jgi:hypothetical protein
MDFKETGFELALDKVQKRALAKTVVNLQVILKLGNVLAS